MHAKSWLLQAAEASGHHFGEDPAAFDAAYVQKQIPKFAAIFGPDRYFDVHATGWENVPSDPAFVVSNHSGGTIVTDALGLGASWYQQYGSTRPLHGMVHEVVFANAASGRFFERCGALRASRTLAIQAIKEFRRHVIVMPGGDVDVWRPASKRYEVCFAGRTGYAETAARIRTPILPVAHVGAHHTLHVLTDGRRFAKKVGFIHHIARAEVFPIHISFPWGLAIGPWPHLPPPTRFDYRFATPIEPPQRTTAAAISAFDREVRQQIQNQLDAIRDMRPSRPTLRSTARRIRESALSLKALRDAIHDSAED